MNHDPRSPDGETPAIGELAEIAARDPDRLATLLAGLSASRVADLALRLEPERRLELLLHGPAPMRAVRAMPDSELYLTVRELGPTDALPLVALASRDQLVHLLDLESWRRDRFDPVRCGAWLALLLEAGEPTLRRVLRAADDALLTLVVARWMRARPLEASDEIETYGRELTERGDELGPVSPDGYFRLSPEIPEQARAVAGVAQVLFVDQPERYRRVFQDAGHALPAEIEEEALRWRTSRLEEHGYPPWDEAIDVYTTPRGGERGEPVAPPPPTDPDGLPAPRLALRVLDGEDELLARAIDALPSAERERVLHELVALANRLLVADGADTGHPGSHRAALRAGASGVRIGLERAGAGDPDAARAGLERRAVIDWFRAGFGAAATLADEARRMLGEAGWGGGRLDAVQLLDEPLGGRLAGLLEPRPRYLSLDEEGRGTLRPFASAAEIDETRAALAVADAVGELLVGRLGLDPARLLDDAEARREDPPPFSAAWSTLLARHATRGEIGGAPLPEALLHEFVRDVVSRRTAPAGAAERATERLLERLAAGGAIDPSRRGAVEGFARACLARLDAALGDADPRTLPRDAAAGCLLLASD